MFLPLAADFSGIMDTVRASFDTGNIAIGLVIALLASFMMSRYGQLIYYTVIALIFDLFVVPVGIKIYDDEMNFGGALDFAMEEVTTLSENLQYVMIRAVFFIVAITVFSVLKSVLRRGS